MENEAVEKPQGIRPPLYVNIAHFSVCSDVLCPFETTEESHLLINRQRVDIAKEGNAAVAVSYAWGNFEHTRRLVGHDPDGKSMHILLGAEWDTADFTSTLVRLSVEQGGCWIDQLCMPQKDEEEIRRTLASIPSVYRTLGVAILFPGAPCKCLLEGLRRMNRAKESGTYEEFRQTLKPFPMRNLEQSCINIIPVSSWFTRVWTRQEMLYARSIRVIWTKLGTSPCAVESDLLDGHQLASELDRFSPFLRLQQREYARASYDENYAPIFDKGIWYCLRQSLTAGTALSRQQFLMAIYVSAGRLKGAIYEALTGKDSTRDALERSKERAQQKSNRHGASAARENRQQFITSAWWAILFWDKRASGWSDLASEHLVFKFFAGDQLTLPAPQQQTSLLVRFLEDLADNCTSTRSCTQLKDYVKSVWVDCPDYVLPPAAGRASLPALLDDALNQLRTNHACAPVTAAPSGLFGAQSATGLWVPSTYLVEGDIQTARDLYKPLYGTLTIPSTETGSIPLRLTGRGSVSLSDMAVDYIAEYGGQSTKAAWRMIQKLTNAWSTSVPVRILSVWPATGIPSAKKEQKGNWVTHTRRIMSNAKKLVGFLYRAGVKVILAGGSPLTDKAFSEEVTHPDELEFLSCLEASAAGEMESSDDSWIKKELNHYGMLYLMVANAVGLPALVCHRRGLRLMVSLDSNPPCIGLANPEFFLPWKYQKQAGAGARAVTRTVQIHTDLLYEVMHVAGTETGAASGGTGLERAQFRVFGVWVPLKKVPHEYVYAEMKRGSLDACII
ncbi:hypothetical protein BDW75DRAFT_217071 [Aspergillus navahoensis]